MCYGFDRSGLLAMLKRLFDVLFSIAAGLLALPVFIILAVTVRIVLGSPVMFSQERAGKERRPFMMKKFRSMTSDVDPDGKLLSDDERTGKFGALLRRSRLDELPELWSIVIGDMSVIGPRPILLKKIHALGERGILRCSVRPGLTGWAQINGNTKLTDDEKVDLDIWYIENRTCLMDAEIIAKTVLVMIFGERRNEKRLAAAVSAARSRDRLRKGSQ
ncbi:lipopolysaccharide/colanic/teichoic acid biosynthesis glycosyltransferase [Rhizobium azibense]|uniref:Lipopolysaccharide/colanic/teichoic acid biosynthesis glycosyltransferase n=2 Tax=Rhizobium azibense TaxID=1136135 RepID=A0A4R3RJQ4_9HYPH|nr:lipopolysaccharide/colanic/teichoic acid biosynthesis glycosyltransferase [Rhizobium azibense]